MFIKVTIILAGVKSSVFLFNKEEGCCLRGTRWMDFPIMEVLIEKVFGGFSFVRRERIELSDLQDERVGEIYFMVIGLRWGNVVSGFLGEHRKFVNIWGEGRPLVLWLCWRLLVLW